MAVFSTRLLFLSALPLLVGGCAASIAASAVGLAVREAQGEPESNAHLHSQAARECSAHAAQYGTARIIDVVQERTDRLVVWGTVGEGEERRSFECRFTTRVTGFKLREIRRRPQPASRPQPS